MEIKTWMHGLFWLVVLGCFLVLGLAPASADALLNRAMLVAPLIALPFVVLAIHAFNYAWRVECGKGEGGSYFFAATLASAVAVLVPLSVFVVRVLASAESHPGVR